MYYVDSSCRKIQMHIYEIYARVHLSPQNTQCVTDVSQTLLSMVRGDSDLILKLTVQVQGHTGALVRTFGDVQVCSL